MRDDQSILDVLDATAKRRAERRNFLRYAGTATAVAGGMSLLAACGDDDDDSVTPLPTPSPTTAITDVDILNFALQLEYLEAQFYSYALTGSGLPTTLLTGVGTQGAVATAGTGAGQPRAVSFASEPLIGQYAREIAADEIAHVTFLRTAIGAAAAAQPAINISGDATGAFTAAARAAGIPGTTATTGTFDPYASPDNFLLGAFIFEDVGVTAYKGAARLLTSKVFLEAAAGILAAEAYHAGLVRTILYNRGQGNAALISNAGLISDARDSLDGTTDDDQGIVTGGNANLVPTDANSLVYSRNTNQVLHIAYLNGAAGTTQGGFFPAGVNGSIRTAAANP